MLRERGLTVDDAGFNAAMAQQRAQARAAGKFKMAQGLEENATKVTARAWVTDNITMTAQKIGAARTYACRYTLLSAACVDRKSVV